MKKNDDEAPRSCEQELVDAAPGLVLALRSGEGLDEARYDDLVRVLRRCSIEWRGAACIPRVAVNVLVDLQPAILAAADAYQEDERGRIVDRAIRLGDLIRESVALGGGTSAGG